MAVKNSSHNPLSHNTSFMNETMKELSLNPLSQSTVPGSEHEALLRRTLMKLSAEETLRKRESREGANLIGFPSYEIMINDDAFEQDKKNQHLSSSLK